MQIDLRDPAIEKLETLVEEGIRADKKNITRFLEPAEGTLRRARSKRHHLIFGRRGSGKSSLLYKSFSDLGRDGHPTSYVDLEPFKGHHYPDLLISVLVVSFAKYYTWLEQHRCSGLTFWLKARLPWTDERKSKRMERLLRAIERETVALRELLYRSDGAEISEKTSSSEQSTVKNHTKAKIAGSPLVSETALAMELEQRKGRELSEAYKRSKQDYLNRKIGDFRAIFQEFSELTQRDCFLFLDDLYHIFRADQPYLLDYMHRIAKSNNVWLKIGTIKNRSLWYRDQPQPMGLKLGDDADEIDLDITLENFVTCRDFQSKILAEYIAEAAAPDITDLLAEGGLDRIVLSSGGVTRDFLGIFRRSIGAAKERLMKKGDSARGPKIGAEDVNVGVGAYGDLKKQEFQRDTKEDQVRLEEAFEKIRVFCLERNKTNVFLVEQEARTANTELIQELIDLRMVHQIKSRISVTSRPGIAYRALLLDMSQYVGERRRKDIEVIEFWKEANKDVIRKASLVYDPEISLDQLKMQASAQKAKTDPADSKSEDARQLPMPFIEPGSAN
jgi:hypothetical protein